MSGGRPASRVTQRNVICLLGLGPPGGLAYSPWSVAARRPARDTLSAGGGTTNAAYFVPTPAV